MKVTRDFAAIDRYRFDFDKCTSDKGFAQVDTSQDAWYFGTWANPKRLTIVTYCEGDVTILEAENGEEFVSELRAIKQWNDDNGHKFKGIDPMCREELKQQFVDLGVGDLLH